MPDSGLGRERASWSKNLEVRTEHHRPLRSWAWSAAAAASPATRNPVRSLLYSLDRNCGSKALTDGTLI